MVIPFVDLQRQHAQIAAEVEAGIAEVLERGDFIMGEAVRSFESEFAVFSGVEYCVGVANGTDALELALRALEVGHGDEVIVPANTFIATGLAAVRAGARVVLVDCDPEHYLIDPDRIEAAITPRTRAAMPVHLYGQMAPLGPIAAAAGNVPIVEDAAQSQGASQQGTGSGSVGVIAGTSFYPGKNIGAYGDGGAVLTNDPDLADNVRKLRNYGSEVKYHHPEVGFNSRLDTIQAVVLRAKLKLLDAWNQQRRAAAARYEELLSGLEAVTLPATLPGNEHVWHLYVVRVPERDTVLAHLSANGVGAGIHYPVPMHLHGAMSDLGYQRGDFPEAEKASDEILSLPIFPGITDSEQEQVAEALAGALRSVSG